MTTASPQEFHYRVPGRVGGWRPGSHPGTQAGAGHEFMSHARLYDWPDPRRLDLRASLRSVGDDLLVRRNRQRAGISIYAIVDVSASMGFGARRPKLHIVADFLESLGFSAFRAGDALGLIAFDAKERPELFVPARVTRGLGTLMAASVRACRGGPGSIRGLEHAATRLAGRPGLFFLVSDFHWPLERLGRVLDALAYAIVVPVVVWDHAEIEPPDRAALAAVSDAESGTGRTLWVRARTRAAWRAKVAQRRAELDTLFVAHGLRPFYVLDSFDAAAMSRYFLEASV